MTAEIVAADDETLAERRMRSLSLRNAGATFTQIAERCQTSPTQARKDVERARRDLIDESTRESLIADQRAVILDIRRANYSAMASGDIDAARIMLASLEREAKLFGLDAPTRSFIGIGTDIEFAESLATLIESVGYRPPSDLLFTARGDRSEVIDMAVDEPVGVVDGDTRPVVVSKSEWTNIGRDTSSPATGYPEPVRPKNQPDAPVSSEHDKAPAPRDGAGAVSAEGLPD